MKCPNCGEELLEGAKFCTSCGHKIEAKIETPKEQEKVQEDIVTPMTSKETIRAFQSKEKTISEKIKAFAYDQWHKLELYGKVVTIEVILLTVLLIVALLTRKIPAIFIVVFQFALVIAASLYHLGLIETDKKKNWMKWLMLCVAAGLTFLNITSYSWGTKKQYPVQDILLDENENHNSGAEKAEEVTSTEEVASEETKQTEQTSIQDDRPNKNGFDSSTNEIYSMGNYTIEIPDYWRSENKITDGIQRYAETDNKVAMLQITASEDSDEDYSVTFESLEKDNDEMIQALELTIFQKVTDHEVLDTGIVKGMLYKGTINETDTFFKDYGLTGYGEWFVFPSESDRKWCYVAITQTDNTDYSYLDDFRQMLLSIKEIGSEQNATTEVTSESSETTISQESSIANTDNAKEENLTIDNCPELAAMLANKADLDPSYAEFAKNHSGQKIEFDGRIDFYANHGKYKTRYDYLVGAGDYDPDHQTGPSFKFNDVNYYDLNTDLETVKVGQNVHIIAVVESYDSNSGLFFLDPVSITGR